MIDQTSIDEFTRCGACLVRAKLPVPKIEAFAGKLDGILSDGVAGPEGIRISGAARSMHVDRLLFLERAAIEAQDPDSPGMVAAVLSQAFQKIATALFGQPTKPELAASICRKQWAGEPDLHLPYHQDGRVVGHAGRSLTVWVPLTDGAGRTSPGLEVVPFGVGSLLETDGGFYNGIPPSSVAPLIAAHGTLDPVFALGDFFIFRDDVVHRTSIKPGMTDPRLSIEYRIMVEGSDPWPELVSGRA